MNCPNCKVEIAPDNINIQVDTAKCSYCGTVFKVSEQLHVKKSAFDLKTTPNQAWYYKERDDMVLGASLRNRQMYFFVPFAALWAGGVLTAFTVFIFEGVFLNTPFILLPLLPFLVASIFMISMAALMVAGKVEFRLNKRGGTVFTGVGNIGIKREFLWADVDTITERSSTFIYPSQVGLRIALEGKKRIAVGARLSDERRFYCGVCKKLCICIRAIETAKSNINHSWYA
ncbi:hypothetical protein NBRC110019_20090 [Neptunitalea chrysea]|uniref:Uncharacterized protein n=1 Tax=Neptunitalea chrysea TaxID=1647581 RepID=A0A9W6EUT1_9FLAO|nr:hypothetical protein [Neptunitalea chrysea]GLB52969.1 hypothetical protein NBRC110019_20090 [Neptunitalea chrysea]